MEPPHLSTEKSVVHCRQTRTLPGAGSVLHLHNFEALSAKNLKCAIFIGVFVNHDCAVSRLFLAGMRGDTGPLKATDTIRDVMSGPMAFMMEDPDLFHAASLLSIAKSNSASVNHSRFDMPAAMTRLLLSAFARRSSRQSCSKRRSLLCLPKTSSCMTSAGARCAPPQRRPICGFFLRKVPGAIRVSSLKICGWRTLGTRWRRPADDEAGWYGSLGA
jgi:hypothetical protein